MQQNPTPYHAAPQQQFQHQTPPHIQRRTLQTPVGASAPTMPTSSAATPATPFFADAMLDLDEAHDIAETPEAVKLQFDSGQIMNMKRTSLQVPSLADSNHSGGQHRLRPSIEDPALSSLHSAAVSDDTQQPQAPTAPQEKTTFTRITGGPGGLRRQAPPQANGSSTNSSVASSTIESATRPSRMPRWPRDLIWAVAFWAFTPVSLLWPIVHGSSSSAVDSSFGSPLSSAPLSTVSLHTLWWSGGACFVLSRILYRTIGGGDGDDARHVAAHYITLAAPISVCTLVALLLYLWWALPGARLAILFPMWFTFHALFLYRRWKRQSQLSGAAAVGQTAPATSGTRAAFFQALTCMVLDILSRSLRRASFYRVLSALLGLQFFVLMLWRWALLAALRHTANGSVSLTLIFTIIGGKWATGTVARLLSLLACGGVTSWFIEQSALVQEIPNNTTNSDVEQASGGSSPAVASSSNPSMPEAYRTVDASVYQSVLAMDDALDDDYENDGDEDDEFLEAPPRRLHPQFPFTRWVSRIRRHRQAALRAANNAPSQNPHQSTVKSLLFAGLTVSFGSVALCGLLGGLAQFFWAQIRKVEAAQTAIVQIRNTAGFSAMRIGTPTVNGGSGSRARSTYSQALRLWASRCMQFLRDFVRSYSDLGMTHVAAYYKSYQRAARDVAVLIDESGVEPILHDDITTHMCACVGGAISSTLIILTTWYSVYEKHREHMTIGGVSDWQIAENMLLSFILSYTLIFTVMEPLRAAIKAVYVSFAQHPRSLSQAFPLIFHRLSRLSESNAVT